MTENFDAVVVGAGFAGLRALYTLREMGMKVLVIDAADDIGGVWHFNRYPGARCDVESFDYSYSFSPELEQEWRWTERYATQPEILSYIHHVADRFELRRDIKLNTRMVEARYDQPRTQWNIVTENGMVLETPRLILALGQLSMPKETRYPGQERFAGRVIYSAVWPKEPVDFAGKRVAIIGTGSSGVQMTPIIARQAAQLTVFQRTANYSIPAANAPVSDEEDAAIKARYAERRQQARNSPSGLGFVPDARAAFDVPEEEREAAYEAAWKRLGFGFALTFKDILLDERSNRTASDFIKRKISEQVDDPAVLDKLLPKDFLFGTRRPSVDAGYFSTFNRDNVRLIDITSTPIESLTETGILTSAEELTFDIIIYATGFDTFTGSLLKPLIVGRGGLTLAQKWEAGPVSYLGIGVHDFPNMFIIGGPGSPSLLSNVLLSSEEQIDWLAGLLENARSKGLVEIEASAAAEREWMEHVNARAKETLYLTTPSYYVGAEMPGKPRVFMPYSGGVRGYRRILEKTAFDDYAGFSLRCADNATVA